MRSGSRLRLLCIEDSPADAELEAASLERAGYDVRMDRVDNEVDLRAALGSGAYDVIFLDHGLPGWDSRAALRAAREAAPQTPVVCVAGTIGEETAVEMLKQGASDYVLKDRTARLPAAVRGVLERAASRRARDEAEASLRASEERYRRIVETAAEGIVTTGADFTITYYNQRLAEMLGYGVVDLLGRSVRELVPSDDDGFVEAEEAERMRSGRGSFQRRLRRADGSALWVSVAAQPILDEEGDFAGALAMISDISDQKAAEDRLKQALVGTVAAMGSLVESRDPYTAGHERRSAALVVAIAGEMRLDDDALAALDLMARMHDIGQIAVPAEILTRPGPLSASEFSLVKLHPQVAFDILAPIDFGYPAAEIILQHHERLDGSGYPNGLRGDEIRLEARVLAVADVVEAMSSHRPYRAALGIEAALDEVHANAGRLYDPDVAAACERVFAAGFTFPD
ncbi:MAG TPA: HD domain-containing phosphohydrolase [Thermoleophilia bacterium]|nr:HD domain-containing phosphohydrolase [Thermoleophilia bacterium]